MSRELKDLIRRLARENPRWGSIRIVGELHKLGYDVSAQTVRRYRRDARHHPPSQSWRTFLRNHAPHIWAADFFTVQTVTFKTLFVFFFVSHYRRKLVHLNVTVHPTAEWVWRQLIEATPWGEQPNYLIRDRDCCYGGSFNPRAARLGIEAILTPVQAPRANAVAERLVGTLRRECLDHVIIINERQLRRVLWEYAAHYNEGRPHRSLDLETPIGPPARASPRRPGGGWENRGTADPWWSSSRVRMGGCLRCADTDVILVPHSRRERRSGRRPPEPVALAEKGPRIGQLAFDDFVEGWSGER